MQQLLQPDQEEKEDDAIQPDGLVDLFAETPAPRTASSCIPCPPIGRATQHRFRYFLDGAMRSYFLCSASEREASEPVILGEIGSAAMYRLEDGNLRPADIQHRLILLVNGQRFSDVLMLPVRKAAEEAGLPSARSDFHWGRQDRRSGFRGRVPALPAAALGLASQSIRQDWDFREWTGGRRALPGGPRVAVPRRSEAGPDSVMGQVGRRAR